MVEPEQLILRVGKKLPIQVGRVPDRVQCLHMIAFFTLPPRGSRLPWANSKGKGSSLLVTFSSGVSQMPLLTEPLIVVGVERVGLMGKQIELSDKAIAVMLKNLLLRLKPGPDHKKPMLEFVLKT